MTCAISNGILNVPDLDHVDNDELCEMLEDAMESLCYAVAEARQSDRHAECYYFYLEVAAEVGRRRFMSAMLH